MTAVCWFRLVAGCAMALAPSAGAAVQSGFRSFTYFDPRTTEAVIGVLNTTHEARPDASNSGWDALTHRAVALAAP